MIYPYYYLASMNHIMTKLPDNLITSASCMKFFRGFHTERPRIEIFFHESVFVNLKVTNYKEQTVITNKIPIYLEYDSIADWLLDSIGFIDLTDYFWHPVPKKINAQDNYESNSVQKLQSTSLKTLTENDVETILCKELCNKHIRYERQLRCDIGTADVVTNTTIFEVKRKLDRRTLYQAIGQLYAYRGSINPEAKLVVCFAEVSESEYPSLLTICNSAGIQLKQIFT